MQMDEAAEAWQLRLVREWLLPVMTVLGQLRVSHCWWVLLPQAVQILMGLLLVHGWSKVAALALAALVVCLQRWWWRFVRLLPH